VPVDEDEVEAVAQAIYDTLECARGWEREPEVLKERLRNGVRATINKLDEHREIAPARDIAPLIVTGDIRHSLEFLMNSPDVSALGMPSSQACRVVLRGSDLTIDAANEAFVRAVGRGGFLGLPSREAFPEVIGQGYFRLMDQVYQTKSPLIGFMMPILFQPRKGAAMEEHITDFVYRPIEDGMGKVTGLFVESYDRTERARA
jgi:PAS domain-containing protein